MADIKCGFDWPDTPADTFPQRQPGFPAPFFSHRVVQGKRPGFWPVLFFKIPPPKKPHHDIPIMQQQTPPLPHPLLTLSVPSSLVISGTAKGPHDLDALMGAAQTVWIGGLPCSFSTASAPSASSVIACRPPSPTLGPT